jgi:hypothetical protein
VSDGHTTDTFAVALVVEPFEVIIAIPDTVLRDSTYIIGLGKQPERAEKISWHLGRQQEGMVIAGDSLVWTPTENNPEKDTLILFFSYGPYNSTEYMFITTVQDPPQVFSAGPGLRLPQSAHRSAAQRVYSLQGRALKAAVGQRQCPAVVVRRGRIAGK